MSEYYGTPAGAADPHGYGHATQQQEGWYGSQYPGPGGEYSSGPSMSPAPPGATTTHASPAPAQPGAVSGQPEAARAQAATAPAQPDVPGPAGTVPAQPHVSPAPAGTAPAQPGYPPGRPGLLDTSFTVPTTQQTAKVAYIAVICLCAVLVLVGLLRTVGHFAAIQYSGVAAILGGLSSLLLYGALAFAVLTVGRLVIDYLVQEDRKRS
ncbi:MAG TPA: hypothetical protein VK086_02645 [Ruania sp.]|nr:hypothetical protein [Ruania sp.]